MTFLSALAFLLSVIFFDSLHHSLDEQKAVSSAYRALKPGGVLIASETAVGHEARYQHIVDKYDVTEKEMPPRLILKLGKRAGFRKRVVYPRADFLGKLLYGGKLPYRWISQLLRIWPMKYLAALTHIVYQKHRYGLVVMYK